MLPAPPPPPSRLCAGPVCCGFPGTPLSGRSPPPDVKSCRGSPYLPWLTKPQRRRKLPREPSCPRPGMALRKDSVQPQACSGQVQWPPGLLKAALPADSLPGAAEPSARNRRPGLRSQAACGVCPAWGPDALTPGLAALPCMLHPSPHPCRSQPVRSHCSLLSSLAESPSLYRMSTKDWPPLPTQPPCQLASPRPPAHVCDPPRSFPVPHRTLYFAHSEQCLALFMVYDAVNENKYGSL